MVEAMLHGWIRSSTECNGVVFGIFMGTYSSSSSSSRSGYRSS